MGKEREALPLPENERIFSTARLLEAGLSRRDIKRCIEEGKLEGISKGLYMVPGEEDQYLYFSQRIPKGVFSHETALFLWGVLEKEPDRYHITIRSGLSAVRITSVKDNIRVHYVKKDFLELGKSAYFLQNRGEIQVYDRERSVLDLVKNRKKMEINVFHAALKSYFSSPEKNLRKLLEYAKIMGLRERIMLYIDVLV